MKIYYTQVFLLIVIIVILLTMPLASGCNSQSETADGTKDSTEADGQSNITISWRPYFEPSIYNGIWEGESTSLIDVIVPLVR